MPGTLARSSDLAHFGIPPPIEAADIDEATLLIREALQAQADVAGIRRSVAAAEDAIAGQERLIRDTYRDFGLAHTPGPDEYTGAERRFEWIEIPDEPRAAYYAGLHLLKLVAKHGPEAVWFLGQPRTSRAGSWRRSERSARAHDARRSCSPGTRSDITNGRDQL